MTSSMCRVCLVGNIRMLTVDDDNLLDMYEKFTNTKLKTETPNRMPTAICYICHRQLQKSYKFCKMAQDSNKTLQDLLLYGDEDTHNVLTMLSLESRQNLLVTPTRFIASINGKGVSPVNIKRERVANREREQVPDREQDVGSEEQDVAVEEQNMAGVEPNVGGAEQDVAVEEQNMAGVEPNVGGAEQDVAVEGQNVAENAEVNNKDRVGLIDNIAENAGVESAPQLTQCVNTSCHDVVMEGNVKNDVIEIDDRDDAIVIDNRNDVSRRGVSNANEVLVINDYLNNIKKTVNIGFNCNVCNKTIKTAEQVIKHMKIHKTPKLFPCVMCKATFSRKTSLEWHLLRHATPKLYDCTVCQKKFTLQSELTAHMQTHFPPKPYTCKVCHRKFAVKNNYTRHLNQHGLGQPFRFTEYLTRHL